MHGTGHAADHTRIPAFAWARAWILRSNPRRRRDNRGDAGHHVLLDALEDLVGRLALVREVVEFDHAADRRLADFVVQVGDALLVPLALVDAADVIDAHRRVAGDA